MMRAAVLAVIATLVLPILALATMIGRQESLLAGAAMVSVPVTGVDPRDPLHGRYIVAQLDWAWAGEPQAPTRFAVREGALCVLSAEKPKPRVRFLDGWKPGDDVDADCLVVIKGRGWPREGGLPARFVPESLDAGGGLVHLYVAETRAGEIERLLRARPGGLTLDLAVRPDGLAAIKALRLDGRIIGQ